MDKRILISGISGFAGSYLAKYFVEKGAEVFGIVRRRADGILPKNIVDRNIEQDVNLLEADLLDITSIGCALDVTEPDIIFHLAAQSYVPRSFKNPIETFAINTSGTANLLEAVRMKDIDPVIVFAGSSEEYGLVFSSESQYNQMKEKYGKIFPEPDVIPELPIDEKNPLRPMSPYAVSKVQGDFMMRNYYHSYGLKTVVSRAFNHEGAGRGIMFVTSVITNQVMKLRYGETDRIKIGNVNAFRDWSHILDIVNGYAIISEKGSYGDVYVQGSKRTHSVLSYILLSLEEAGYEVRKISTIKNNKKIDYPTSEDRSEVFGIKYPKLKIDQMLLEEQIAFDVKDKGINVETDKGTVPIIFDESRFRSAEVPILLSNPAKIEDLGFRVNFSLRRIIKDQLNYFMDNRNRQIIYN